MHLDLADPASVRRAVEATDPDLVLNCAAVSSLTRCESEPDLAERVNALGPTVLAEAGVRVLQVSTDLVFDGRQAPYPAEAKPHPLSGYGRTKAAAEQAIAAAGGLVVRVPLLFGRSFDGRRGATDMIRRAEHERLALFTNEYRTPLHVADAARGLVGMLLDRDRAGVVHLAGVERISRWDLGQRFAKAVGLSVESFVVGECHDPLRPRDVSMITDWDCGRTLDEALREC